MPSPSTPPTPLRLLIVLPSWVGDCVMATPTLRLLRDSFRGSFIGALVKPGIDHLLGGLDVFDEVHVDRQSGIMQHKHAAAKLRPRRYDSALLLRNSFSSAFTVRMAGIPRRIGYARDARTLLLTDSIPPPRTEKGDFAIVPAVDYYWNLAVRCVVGEDGANGEQRTANGREKAGSGIGTTDDDDFARRQVPDGIIRLSRGRFMELAASPEDESNARSVLERAGVRDDAHDKPMVMLNPGANKEWKRWPAPRFAALAKYLHEKHNARVLLSGAPNEADLIDSIAKEAAALTGAGRPASAVISLPRLGMAMGGLKAMMKRCRLLVTNDTGPRHIAAALGVPLVSLFGPTDHRWAPIPTRPGASEIKILADPTLPETESANDQPERCAIDKIEVERVCKAVDQFLAPSRPA